MKTKIPLTSDFCIIGGGAGGLSFAAGAAQMGASVILVEARKMGGDCLHFGCIPSKALLAAARIGATLRTADQLGWEIPKSNVNFQKVKTHIQKTIAAIAPHDSIARFEGLGVKVISEAGMFTSPRHLETDTYSIRAKRFIIATGSIPFIPPIPGLNEMPYLTNETIFELNSLPEHLVIIGGGPIGIEMAQAFHNLGSQVTVLEAGKILPKDDPDMTAPLKARLIQEGIVLAEQVRITKIIAHTIHYQTTDDQTQTLTPSHILIATGRRPHIQHLNLSAAQVNNTPQGITVNARLETSNPRIYAIGDCTGGYLFTHMAGYHAQIALRNTVFGLRTKVKTNAIPWVTYTDLELAQVGATEPQLKQNHTPYKSFKIDFSDNDRAQAENQTDGSIKVLLSPRGKLLGVTILGVHAGEQIYPWCLAFNNNLSISAIAHTLPPYPTVMEINTRIAGAFYSPKIFSPWMHKLVRFLLLRLRA